MATAKYKGKSPYAQQQNVPATDHQYNKFISQTCLASNPIRTALFGLGRIGLLYLKNIQANPDICLLYIVISPRQNPDKIRTQFNIPQAITITCDENVVYNDPSITACIIASSTDTHLQIILRCLEVSKAVYCEKPISQSLPETIQCYEAARVAKLPLFCALNRRFDPTYSFIQQQVRAGKVGHVQTIKTVSRDSPLIPDTYIGPSGGILDDFAVHDVDLMLWVVGEVPTKVYVVACANIAQFAQHNDYDTMVITLTFGSGTLGTIDLNRYSCYGYDQRLEVVGVGGMLHCENSRPDTVVHHTTHGSTQTPPFYSFPSHYDTAFRQELAYFVELVRGEAELSVTGSMTCAVAKVLAACKESVSTGLPVSIAWQASEIPDY